MIPGGNLRMLLLPAAAAACLVHSSCGGDSRGARVRLGYFPNITHSQAVVGIARGDFQSALGDSVELVPILFNAGPSVIEAIYAGEVDMAYIGPNPAVNGFVRSGGEALRVIAGATSGGASLVVRGGLDVQAPAGLAGLRLATPQLGNTQDVALRVYLSSNGLWTADAGGDVEIIPAPNPQILDMFRQGQIDGAWVPEPWATRLLNECGGTLLVDERSLWPDGEFTTALLIVSTSFLEEDPDIVRRMVDAHVSVTLWERENPDEAAGLLCSELGRLTGSDLDPATISGAFGRMEPTWDPLLSTLSSSARAAWTVGFLDEEPDLEGIYDPGPLEAVLSSRSVPPAEYPVGP